MNWLLVIIIILLTALLFMIKFTKIGQKWFCPALPKVEEEEKKA